MHSVVRRALFLAFLTISAAAQLPESPSSAATQDAASADAAAPTLFHHSDTTRYLISGQANIIFQAHAPFHSPYSGTNSLLSRGEYKPSLLGTVYLAYQLNPHPRYSHRRHPRHRVLRRPRHLGSARPRRLHQPRRRAQPVARVEPYLARYQLHQVVGFTSTLGDSQRTPFSLATRLPTRRLDLHIGRMSLPDFFDVNASAPTRTCSS